MIQSDRKLRWGIVQRAFWLHGVTSLREYLRTAEAYTLGGRVEDIGCPTLLTLAEDDPLTAGTQALYDALQCKTLVRFNAQQGAGGHCEMGNRSLLNRTVLDLLDDVLGVRA